MKIIDSTIKSRVVNNEIFLIVVHLLNALFNLQLPFALLHRCFLNEPPVLHVY